MEILLFFASLLATSCLEAQNAQDPSQAPTKIGPQDDRIALLARYDDHDPAAVRFAYPGSGFVIRFTGPSPALLIDSDTDTAAVTLVLDDGSPVLAVLRKGSHLLQPPGPPATYLQHPHTLAVYKRTETWEGIVALKGIVLSSTALPGSTRLLSRPILPARRLLFVGDSVTCGAGVARDDKCTNNPAHPNNDAYSSYGMVLGRRLDAQAELVCYGGRGVIRDYRHLGEKDGVLNAPQFVPLAVPADDPALRAAWDERSSAPDLIFVSLGTNDFNLEKTQPLDARKFVTTYSALLRHMLQTYPGKQVLVTGGAIVTDPLLDEYIRQAIASVNDPHLAQLPSVHYAGNGCDAHPTAEQHQRMADDFEPEIRSRLHW